MSMVLGGCGATLEELTGLYSAFAHEGKYFRPNYTRAVDGTLATETSKDRAGYSMMSPAATFMINEILSKVNRPDFPSIGRAPSTCLKLPGKQALLTVAAMPGALVIIKTLL
ncbi:hypothetical protein [Paraflavitalea speifideaquila]|uniref:hypothetical protein n=1 Tax=Paraflavitalea speifideaquila TaxID=3076558 RepID=UPI0028EDDF06|nr:hypothetical protein [Paraflavitalea speifideiaquila]